MANLLFLLAITVASSLAIPLTCSSPSQPNPIAEQYPDYPTGVVNGTTAIVLIPYTTARSIVPKEYQILTKAYQELFPTIPMDMYPAVFEAVEDHDVKTLNIGVLPDFRRVSLRFPFVDRLDDGYSSFKYTPLQTISADNPIAVAGSAAYGKTLPATFDPKCGGYASDGKDSTYLNVYVVPNSTELSSVPDVASRFETVKSVPYDFKVFVNVTNQPSFGDGLPVCDNYIVLFNTSVTAAPYAPVPVKGTIHESPPISLVDTTYEDVYGYRMANAFLEKNSIPCEQLQGYAGTGPGDRG